MYLWEQYAEDVIAGRELVCKYTRLAVERHLRDLESSQNEDYPYYFDTDEALRGLSFIISLRHTKGELAGQRFNLQPFQAFRLANILGWRKKENGARRFNKAYVEIARKNGKSEEAAALALYMLVADGERGAEVYSAATMREQARIVFQAAKSMAKGLMSESPTVARLLNALQNVLVVNATDSKMTALASEDNTLDGLNPSMAVVDEYHAHKNDLLLGVLETGMGSRKQPLLFVITTAGFNTAGPCYELRKNVIDVLEGTKEDDQLFGIIYTLDEGDDWQDEAVWKKANPNIGVTPTLDFMRRQAQQARNQGGSTLTHFLTKNLNVWTNASAVWIQTEDYQACENPDFDPTPLRGRRCYGGLDMASVADMNAFSLVFPPEREGEKFQVLRWRWLPRDTALKYESTGNGTYRRWAEQGLIILTEGNVVDHRKVEADIVAICAQYQVFSVAYDPTASIQTAVQLQDAGLRMEVFQQYARNFAVPTKEYERLVMSQQFDFPVDPVQRWMVSNVRIHYGPNGEMKPDKNPKKSAGKIDGVIADIMALGECIAREREKPQGSYLFQEGAELIIF